MAPLNYEELTENRDYESSKAIKKRVLKAREMQKRRYSNGSYNALLTPKDIRKYCKLTDEAKELLKLAIVELNFSGRAYDKILKLALTIADIAEKSEIDAECLSEAISYRSLDRRTWFSS